MKLIEVKTDLTFFDLVNKFENIPLTELEVIYNISKYFDYIDFSHIGQKSGFFAVLVDSYKQRIEDFFQNNSINYDCKDISKDIFFDNPIDSNYIDSNGLDISEKVKEFFSKFKSNYITQDDVLDKILEKGIDSLTDFDKSILK